MATTAPNRQTAPAREDRANLVPRSIDVQALMGEGKLIMIEHGESRYFLRMTRNNKLILTK